MRIGFKFVLTIIFIMLILAYIGTNIDKKSFFFNLVNSSNESGSWKNNIVNITITTTPIINYNDSLSIPASDFIINNINWTQYPNLQTGYVHNAQVCEPNDIVSHKYIAIGIISEVKNGDNRTLIYKQLSEIALEVRRICGPNTAICVFGTDHGVLAWTVTMRVYDDKVYY